MVMNDAIPMLREGQHYSWDGVRLQIGKPGSQRLAEATEYCRCLSAS
jgi:hypothetical protein